jgi:hypothetical protein
MIESMDLGLSLTLSTANDEGLVGNGLGECFEKALASQESGEGLNALSAGFRNA